MQKSRLFLMMAPYFKYEGFPTPYLASPEHSEPFRLPSTKGVNCQNKRYFYPPLLTSSKGVALHIFPLLNSLGKIFISVINRAASLQKNRKKIEFPYSQEKNLNLRLILTIKPIYKKHYRVNLMVKLFKRQHEHVFLVNNWILQ